MLVLIQPRQLALYPLLRAIKMEGMLFSCYRLKTKRMCHSETYRRFIHTTTSNRTRTEWNNLWEALGAVT